MRKFSVLATMINRLSDEQLASLSHDDAFALAEGLLIEPGYPDVDAALCRLATQIWGGHWSASPPLQRGTRRLH